ncbi:MAG: DUF2771 family protein [Antricoccus sp.]
MTLLATTARVRAALALTLMLVLAGCGNSGPVKAPSISVTVKGIETSVPAAVYCIDNKAQLSAKSPEPIVVGAQEKVTINVPKAVAARTWSIEVWSVEQNTSGKPVPAREIGNIVVGKSTSYDKITTSDAVPNQFYLIVTIPQESACNAAANAGLWPILIIRQS